MMSESIANESFEVARCSQVLALLGAHKEAVHLLLGRALGLDGDWRNVPRHCLNVAFIGDELAHSMGIPNDKRKAIVDTLIIHDALKRVQKTADDSASLDAIAHFDSVVAQLDADGSIRHALSEDNTGNDAFTPSQMVARLADNLSMEDTVCPLHERLDEVRRRREAQGQDLREEYGNPHYWEDELEQSMLHASACVSTLREQGHEVTEATLPAFVIRQLLKRIGSKEILATWAMSEHEILSPQYFGQVVAHTPRTDPSKDEDAGWCYAKGDDGWLVVTDGATAIEAPEYFEQVEQTPGYMASHIAMHTAKVAIQTEENSTPSTVIQAMNSALGDTLIDIPIDPSEKSRVFSTCAVVVKMQREDNNVHTLHYVNAGDTALLVMHKDGSCTWLAYGQGEDREKHENTTAFEELTDSAFHSMTDVLSHLSDFPKTLAVINAHRLEENSGNQANVALKGGDGGQLDAVMQSGTIEVHSGDTVFALSDGALPWVTMESGRKQFVEDALRAGGPAELQKRRGQLSAGNADQDNPPCLKLDDDLRIVAMHVL